MQALPMIHYGEQGSRWRLLPRDNPGELPRPALKEPGLNSLCVCYFPDQSP